MSYLQQMNFQEIIESIPLQAAIFCLIGVACIVIAIFFTSGNKKLKDTGLVADGIIYSLQQKSGLFGSNDFDSNVKDKITVRFLTKDDVWITEQLKTSFQISFTGQYKEGQPVKVIYNPDKPSEFMIESRQSGKIGRLIFGLIGLVFLIIGVYQCLGK